MLGCLCGLPGIWCIFIAIRMWEEKMIYCVEDDDSIRELMLYTLKASGFEGRGFPSSESFWAALEQAEPELITLDIMLPGEDGISILKKLRQNKAIEHIPIIMTTAKGTEYDKVMGLDLGADDYLAKPFGMMEMISRIKAVLRRSAPREDADVIKMGEVELSVSHHTVTIGGEIVDMTLKEFELLELFMQNPNIAFSRDTILSRIWDVDYMGETRTVDMHISSLRTKLGDAGITIKTVRGIGYRLEVRHAQ